MKQLLALGCNVAAASRDATIWEKEIDHSSGQFLPLEMDPSDEASVQKAVSLAIGRFQKLDVIVNNAGIGTIEELSDAEARLSFDVNVFGMLNVTRKWLQHC